MKKLLLALLAFGIASSATAQPLRVFIRGGQENRGNDVHAHPRFMADWKKLLTDRGMRAEGALDWPSAAQFAQTDVLVLYAQDGGNATPEQQKNLNDFVKRGGGLVVIHTAAISSDPAWWKTIIGGAWVPGKTKWKEGPMDLYYTESQYLGGGHPITRGASNFHLDDEIYYDMDLAPDIRVLATSFTPKVREGKKPADGGKAHIYDIQPQMWAYERTAEGGTSPSRALVSLPGHLYATFQKPHYRAILLRGIAWAGKRDNLDQFLTKEEIEALMYPEGGPQRPEQTLAAIELHPDFTMKLVAAEPLINKPMNFDWAPDGSLWVAETPEYPNGRRGMRPDFRGMEWKDRGGVDPAPGIQERLAIDKISRLVDSDGDGVMDKKVIFYEGLDLVTGFVFYKDGVIVTQAPDILWLRDTDGDGKADKVEKLYTGLGTQDTHAVINNPRWGWDGWIYATHGYSGSNKVKNVRGEPMPNIGSGVVRFRPDGSAIEQFSSKGGNTWGLAITGSNRVMWTQPTSGHLLMETVLPEHTLAKGKLGNTPSFHVVEPSGKAFPLMTWEQLAYVQIDWVGSFTAAAGAVIYDGGSWPADYDGDYFTTECTINVIHHTRLSRQGSSFKTEKLPGREETEFARSRDMWWRPIEVRVGPDGAMYVADFYNQAVIHNDTRGPEHNKVNAAVRPDRDHYFGRIWRIDHKQSRALPKAALQQAGLQQLAKALEHPNAAIRLTAHRLLAEKTTNDPVAGNPSFRIAEAAAALKPLAASPEPDTRVAALWTLYRCGAVLDDVLPVALKDKDPEVRRNAALIAEDAASFDPERLALAERIGDSDPHVRLAMLRAMAVRDLSGKDAAALVANWKKCDDDFQRSAAVSAAVRNPEAVIAAAIEQPEAGVETLAGLLAEKVADGEKAARLIIAVSGKPATADALKRALLDGFAKGVKNAPAMSPELTAALGRLLVGGASGSTLPLAAKWDAKGTLKGEISKLTASLEEKVRSSQSPDDARIAAAQSLIGLRTVKPGVLPMVVAQLAAEGSADFKRGLIGALAPLEDASIGQALASAFSKLPQEVQPAAFDAVLRRADWSNAFLDAVKAGSVSVAALGPANVARLRTHPDRGVADRAGSMLEELNPGAGAKREVLAKLMPAVGQKGDVAKGKAAFDASCAICHKFGDTGVDIGPGLTGMGTHGAGELLAAIVDPNAEVDPSYVTWNFETTDGQFVSGIIAAENPATITVKSLAGVQEVKVANVKNRVNTGRSLMPEGFEGLGAEVLRDIIAYMQSVDGGRFRTLDLSGAFTASTARGLYLDQQGKSLEITKGGTFTFGGVPFHVVAPEKSATGLNVISLKGGPEGSFARREMPQRVEVKAGGFTANRLHFLGGVGGWAYPFNQERFPVMSVIVKYADGEAERLVLTNGVEFADHIARHDVPGSQFAEGVSRGFQVRWFSKQLKRGAPIAALVLESEASEVAPTTLAITAELADANAAPLPSASAAPEIHVAPEFASPVPQPPAKAKGPRVLLVGGGSAHDFPKYFGGADKGILAPHVGWVDFTMNANGVPAVLDRVDVLVWSANQPLASETRKALMDYVGAGKPLVLLHPGLWYNWKNFPQWNREVCGGGSRGHDRLGEFEVAVLDRAHPITAGLPERFRITDEFYYFEPDAAGTPIEVLAEAVSTQKPGTYPQVFVVKHPKARIVGITLGHDGRAHGLPEFQKLLKQAVLWAAGETALAAK
jgi:putative membrane-bound dehydrogenase-like protein